MLYIGLTTDLTHILKKHKERRMTNFKANFSFDKLIHVEEFSDVNEAIAREIELKGYNFNRKIDLFRLTNPMLKEINNTMVHKTA